MKTLSGIGYREQELQVAKGVNFETEVPNGVSYASFAGNTNIFIKGSMFALQPEQNLLVLESVELDGQKIVAPGMSEEDIFGSNPAAGSISYRLPSISKLFNLPESNFDHYQ